MVKWYSGKHHCFTGSGMITKWSRFHWRSPAAVIKQAVMKPLLVRNKWGRPPSLCFISTIVSSSCSILPSLALVTSLDPLVSFFYLFLIHRVSHPPSPNILPSSPSSYTPIHHSVFPASSSLLFFLSFCNHFQRHWLFCNQLENTGDEKQEKIPVFFYLFDFISSNFALPFFLLSAAQKTYFLWISYQPLWKCQTHFYKITTTAPSFAVQKQRWISEEGNTIFKMVLLEKLWGFKPLRQSTNLANKLIFTIRLPVLLFSHSWCAIEGSKEEINYFSFPVE